MREISVLAIDDDDVDLEKLHRNLLRCDELEIVFKGFRDWQEGLNAIEDMVPDVVFIDYFLGGQTGVDILKSIRERGDDRPIIVLTGQGDEDTATSSIRLGASDYIIKSKLTPSVLKASIERTCEEYASHLHERAEEREQRTARHLEAIGTLAGGVAHDFNNYLAGIMMSAELALSYDPSPKVRKELERIAGISTSAAQVVRRMLMFNKQYAGVDVIGDVNVQETVRNTLSVLQHSCPPGITIDRCGDNDESHIVRGSMGKMHQIVLNLCVNAIEAMEDTGVLRIETVQVEGLPDSVPEGKSTSKGWTKISISDTGPGIPKEIQERMFEPFFSTKNRATTKGTGLGLPTVWECVRDFEGHIEVSSATTSGTCVEVYFPLNEVIHVDESDDNNEPTELTATTILLVDDDESILAAMGGLVERMGHTVYRASNGIEALELFKEHEEEIDIVSLDVTMPEMGGHEVLRKIREKGSDVPVIIVTGHCAESENEVLRPLGIADALQKPYTARKFIAVVQKALATRARLAS